MALAYDPCLQAAVDALVLPKIRIAHRVILPGDEHALLPQEAAAFSNSVVAVRRASGAARIVARQLLGQLGFHECAIPKGLSGAPIWPEGIVGSISHDSSIATAAVALRRDYLALGIDVEPAEALPADLLDWVATPQERAQISEDPYQGRLLFAAKEAVYKAVYPLDGIFLDHHDVTISLTRKEAVTSTGRSVALRFCASSHLMVVAFVISRSGPSD